MERFKLSNKILFLFFIILFLTSSFTYAESEIDYFSLSEGDYWVYQDQIEIQDPQGNFEVENKYIREKVKVKKLNAIRTLKVLSTEDRGSLKIAKMQEEDFQGIKIFFYAIKDGSEVYRFNNEEDLKHAITEDELPMYSLIYVFPLQEASKWGASSDLNRKDRMYFYYVEGIEDITVPAGTFKNCFKIVYNSLPDEIAEWFCPNVGIVRMEYHHHGTILNHISELKGQGEK